MGNCPECNSVTYLDTAHAEIVCSGCSIVVQEGIVEDGPAFTGHESHIGPALRENMGYVSMSTKIWNESRDAAGHPLSRAGRDHVFRLTQTGKRLVPSPRGKSLCRLRDIVHAICGRLSLSATVRDRSFHLAKQAHKKALFRGTDFAVIASAAILLATREANRYPGYLDVGELIETSGLKRGPKEDGRRRVLLRAYRRMKCSLRVPTRFAAEDVLPTVANKLSLTHPQTRRVRALLRKIKPSSNALADVAASIHIALGEDSPPQSKIAKACGTTEVTMRKYVRVHRKEMS